MSVIVRFDADGKLCLQIIEFDEGHKYTIEKVLDGRRAACQTVGGVGDRYTVQNNGQDRYLWFERNRFFFEERC